MYNGMDHTLNLANILDSHAQIERQVSHSRRDSDRLSESEWDLDVFEHPLNIVKYYRACFHQLAPQ
jgi:hypothetical protein